MGNIRTGPSTELVSHLKNSFSLKTFVETGTFRGNTSIWAASIFEQVITIENSRSIYEQTSSQHGHIPNIQFLFGNSKDILRTIVPPLDAPALFWLDGHWSGGETYGENDQCPILEELAILQASSVNHFVLIDDARMFTSPPPYPCRAAEWPTIDELIECIKAGSHDKYITIFEDVIIAIPKTAQESTSRWLQEANTKTHLEWEKQERLKHTSRLWHGVDLVNKGLHLITESALNKLRPEKQ